MVELVDALDAIAPQPLRNPAASNGLYPFVVPLDAVTLLPGTYIPISDADVTRTISSAARQIEAFSADNATIEASLSALIQVSQSLVEAESLTITLSALYYDNAGAAAVKTIEGAVYVVPPEGGSATGVGSLVRTDLTSDWAFYTISTAPGAVAPGSLLYLNIIMTIQSEAAGESGAILRSIVVS